MMKIIAIGILCSLLLQSNVAGEPMVKVKICSDVFANAIKDSLNQIEQSTLKDNFGSIRIERSRGSSWGWTWGQRTSIVIPCTSVQLKDLQRSQILSESCFETRLQATVEYGEKPSRNNRSQNSFLFYYMNIIATVHFKVNRDKPVFSFRDECELYIQNYDTDLPKNFDPEQRSIKNVLELKLCRIVRQLIDNMNENWKDYLVIDPSGSITLNLTSTSKISSNCLELHFNLVIDNSEVTSTQKHDMLSRNGISLLKDYISKMLSEDHLTELNKNLEEKNLQLSPDELQRLIHDVHETESTSLKVIITKMPKLNLNETMTFMIELQGFSSKADKSAFTVIFETKVKNKFLLKDNKLILQFLSTGDQVIHTWNSDIGTSGDLDYNNLQAFLKEMTSETLLPAMNNLDMSCRIPFWNLASKVAVKLETVEIFQ